MMRNVKYEPWTLKYLIVFPIFIICGGIGLLVYRVNILHLDWFTAFINIEYEIISPLILIFGGIVLFYIIFGAQCWEKKMDRLNKKQQQNELRNKIIKQFRTLEKNEKIYMIFYSIVGLLSLTAYVLLASNSIQQAKDLILFLIIGIFVPITQAVKLWKYVRYLKIKKLKIYGKCLAGKIININESGRGFLRDDTMRYKIFAQSDETGDVIYESYNTRYPIPTLLEKGDKIFVYIDETSSDYFVDIESAFMFHEDE